MKKTSLFIADDHQITVDGLEAFIERHPHYEIVGKANRTDQVLAFFEKQQADIAILDIEMKDNPDLDGIQLTQRIRRIRPETKVILLTMHDRPQYILNALATGVYSYIIKEKSKEVLLTALAHAREGKKYFPPDVLALVDGLQLGRKEAPKLTKRQTDIACLMAKEPSLTAKQIGEQLHITKVTVEKHIQNIKDKLNVHRGAEIVVYVMENKLCQ